jgi:streptogramin lyase
VAAGSVWVASTLDDTVSKIDPAGTLRVGTVGRNHSSPTVAAGDGAVWVTVADGDAVLRIRP